MIGLTLNEVCGPVEKARAYAGRSMVGENVNMTLPEVAAQTIEIEAMGKLSLPMWNRLENMETKITKIGTDSGLAAMLGGGKLDLEFRWAQTAINKAADSRQFGCKAFIVGIPISVPGIEIVPGETSEIEMTYATLRYQLFVDERQLLCVDRLAGKCVIGEKDYSKDIERFL
jgi:phage tail tube protein FII